MGSEFLTPDKSEELSLIVRIQKWVQDFWSLHLLGEKETVLIKTSAFHPNNKNGNVLSLEIHGIKILILAFATIPRNGKNFRPIL